MFTKKTGQDRPVFYLDYRKLEIKCRYLAQSFRNIALRGSLICQAQALNSDEGVTRRCRVLRLDRLLPDDGTGVGTLQGPTRFHFHCEGKAERWLINIENSHRQDGVAAAAFDYAGKDFRAGDGVADRVSESGIGDLRFAGCAGFLAPADCQRYRLSM